MLTNLTQVFEKLNKLKSLMSTTPAAKSLAFSSQAAWLSHFKFSPELILNN